MTDYQLRRLRRETRQMAMDLYIYGKEFILTKPVRPGTGTEIAQIDWLLSLYGIRKEHLEKPFVIFYRSEDKEKRKNFIRKAKKLLNEKKEQYEGEIQESECGSIYL